MSKKTEHYLIEREVPVREVMEEMRRRNSGKQKKFYGRHRAFYWTKGFTSIEGAEVAMAKAAITMARQFDGRVVRFAATKYCVVVDFLMPQTIALAKASKLLRRAMSDAHRATKPGAGGNRGYLFRSRERIETLAPLLGTVLSEFQIIHSDEENGRLGATALAMGLDEMEDDDES